VADVVARVAGVQAQDERAAALSVRARAAGLVAADVTAAVVEDRSVVLTWSLRGTRHLHHADDVRWIVALLGPVVGRPGRRAQQLGIAGDVGDRAVRQLRRALAADGPLTRSEVKRRLAPIGVDPTGQAAIGVIHRAAMEGALCVLPGPAGEERYVLVDDWLPASAPVAPERAAAELARRHLAAFGPATDGDFAVWSGLGRPAARRAWAMIGGEMTEVRTSSGPAWVLTGDAGRARAASRRPTGVRLLGAFDALLLGYAGRRLLVDPAHARRINPGGGMVKPVVLADGEAIGTWRRRRERVELDRFRPLTDAESAAVEAEVADIDRFLGRA
jgi:hypothetical protein